MPNKEPKPENPLTKSETDIKGFDIKINEFGEVICSHTMDDINDFLDVNVNDKKLSPQELAQRTNKAKK